MGRRSTLIYISIVFLFVGQQVMDECTVCRIDGKTLEDLKNKIKGGMFKPPFTLEAIIY